MKLKAFMVMFLIFAVTIVYAAKPIDTESLGDEGVDTASDTKYSSTIENWTIFQFALFPGVPGTTYNSAVYGLKLGLLMSGGKGCVGGVEMSLLSSSTARIYGVQMSPFVNIADVMDGLQMCIVTNATDFITGWQMSLINYSQEANGVQFGAVNVDTKVMNGWQTGIYNYSESANGLQLGVVNVAKKCGVQLGLVNVISDGWIPVLPLINISF